jgi:hypothetical protein
MTASRWSLLCVFLAGGLSGAALIGVYADGSVTQMSNADRNTQGERGSEPRRAEAPVEAEDDSTAVTPANEVQAAEKKHEHDIAAEAGRSLAQVLAGLEAEYRRQLTRDSPNPEESPAVEAASPSRAPAVDSASSPRAPAVEAASPSQAPAVEAASPPRSASTSTALIAGQPAEPEQKQRLVPDEALARNASTVATAEETSGTNEQHLVTAQIQQLAALQQLAMAQQLATAQQLAVAQQFALLSYLQLAAPSFTPVAPAPTSPRALPQGRRAPRGAFVVRFPSANTAINNTNNPSGFYSAPAILVR